MSDIQTRINHYSIDDLHPYTWEELRAGIREAEDQLTQGNVYTDEEDDRLFEKFIFNELNAQE